MTVTKFRFQNLEIRQSAIEVADGLFTNYQFSEVIGVDAMRYALCAMRF